MSIHDIARAVEITHNVLVTVTRPGFSVETAGKDILQKLTHDLYTAANLIQGQAEVLDDLW